MWKPFLWIDSSLCHSFFPAPGTDHRALYITEKGVAGGTCQRYRGLKSLQPVFGLREENMIWEKKKKNSLTVVPRMRVDLGALPDLISMGAVFQVVTNPYWDMTVVPHFEPLIAYIVYRGDFTASLRRLISHSICCWCHWSKYLEKSEGSKRRR